MCLKSIERLAVVVYKARDMACTEGERCWNARGSYESSHEKGRDVFVGHRKYFLHCLNAQILLSTVYTAKLRRGISNVNGVYS